MGSRKRRSKPVLVNLHTAAGTGNGMGNIMAAFQNKTPLIITAGQQTREMALCEPFLTNIDETVLPRPYVKWAYQPLRAQDVPGAIMRAYLTAVQPPAGPVYVVIPLDDWDQPALGEADVRTASTRFAPDPIASRCSLSVFVRARTQRSSTVRRSIAAAGWDAAIEFAEQLQAPVYLPPMPDRVPFPMTHPQFRGALPMAIGPARKAAGGA